jgi:hypothetical protein
MLLGDERFLVGSPKPGVHSPKCKKTNPTFMSSALPLAQLRLGDSAILPHKEYKAI